MTLGLDEAAPFAIDTLYCVAESRSVATALQARVHSFATDVRVKWRDGLVLPFFSMKVAAPVIAVCLGLWADGCQSDPGPCGVGEGSYYPLEDGAWWRMREVDPQTGALECPDKVVRVEGGEQAVDGLDGVVGFKLISERANETGHRWQTVDSDGSVHRVIDRWFDLTGELIRIERYCPDRIRVEDGARACKGATWDETYSTYVVSAEAAGDALPSECEALELDAQCQPLAPIPAGCIGKHSEEQTTYEVQAEDEPVETPAGTFNAMVVSNDDGDRIKTFWWARGVGKIKEVSNESEEELVAYCVPSQDPGCEAERPRLEELNAECP